MQRAVQVVSIHEAGLDGFWVHRMLQTNGVESQVVDAASVAVDRRSRRVKTDRIDVESERSGGSTLRSEPAS